MRSLDDLKIFYEIIENVEKECDCNLPEETIISLKKKDFDETMFSINELLSTQFGRSLILEKINNTIKNSKILNDIDINFKNYYFEYPREISKNIVSSELNSWNENDNNMPRFWDYYLKLKDLEKNILDK